MPTSIDAENTGLLFSNSKEPRNGKILFVNKYRIVEVLQKLKKEESLTGFRDGVVI